MERMATSPRLSRCTSLKETADCFLASSSREIIFLIGWASTDVDHL